MDEIGDLYGINSSTVFYILKEVLKLRKDCASGFGVLEEGSKVRKSNTTSS